MSGGNMDNKEKDGEYLIDIAKMKKDIVMHIINYAWSNNLDEKTVLHYVLNGLEEIASDTLDKYIEILNSDNKEDIMAAIRRQNKIKEDRLRRGDFNI